MKKSALVSIVELLCVLSVGLATSKPNFSGTWVLDKNRSFSNPAGLDQTLTIVHTGDQIKLEGKLITPRGEQPIDESYTLDGKEAEFTPPGAPQGSKGKRKASWLADGRGVLVIDEVTRDAPSGPVTEQTTRKWTLSTDGTTLTIDYYFDTARGSFEAKRVFVKK
jgi:hypothetical protein